MTALADYADWYLTWVLLWLKAVSRELWNDLPGPLWVKVLLTVILLSCLVIPGPVDELLVFGLIRGWRYYSRRRNARMFIAQAWDESSERLAGA